MLLDAARSWNQRGLLAKTSLAKLEAELVPLAGVSPPTQLSPREAALVLAQATRLANAGRMRWTSIGPIQSQYGPHATAWAGAAPDPLYPRDFALLLNEARAWEARGLLPASTLWDLQQAWGSQAEPVAREDARVDGAKARAAIGTRLLQVVAGLLLGGAFVLAIMLTPRVDRGFWLLLAGLLPALLSVVLLNIPRTQRYAHTLLVAGLVPLTTAPMVPAVAGALVTPAMASATVLAVLVAIPWLRHTWSLVSGLTISAWCVTTGFFSFHLANEGAWTGVTAPATVWLGLLAVSITGFTFSWRVLRPSWHVYAMTTTLATAVIPAILLLDAARVDATGIEAILGASFLALLALGLWLRDPGLAVAGGAGIAVDAIVFAFTAGGGFVGVGLLVVLAVVLLALGAHLQRVARPAWNWLTLRHNVQT